MPWFNRRLFNNFPLPKYAPTKTRLDGARPKIRFFSALTSEIPTEVLDYFKQNRHLISAADFSAKTSSNQDGEGSSTDSISALAQDFFSYLSSQATSSDSNLNLYLRRMSDLRSGAGSVLFKGLPKELFESEQEYAEFLKFFSAATADIAGYKPNADENYMEIGFREQDHLSLMAQRKTTKLLPHIDDLFATDAPLKFLIFVGIEASHKNYRTYLVDHAEVVSKISQRSKAILQEPIFQNRHQFYKAQPILVDLGNGNYGINFSTEEEDRPWFFDFEKLSDKTITTNQAIEAIEDIESAILETYHQNKVTEYYISDGDFLCMRNSLHGRDQHGVSQENLFHTRIIGSYSYTDKPSPAIALTEVAKAKVKETKQR